MVKKAGVKRQKWRGISSDYYAFNLDATILPILYRRPSMYIYENILPASLEVQDPKETQA